MSSQWHKNRDSSVSRLRYNLWLSSSSHHRQHPTHSQSLRLLNLIGGRSVSTKRHSSAHSSQPEIGAAHFQFSWSLKGHSEVEQRPYKCPPQSAWTEFKIKFPARSSSLCQVDGAPGLKGERGVSRRPFVWLQTERGSEHETTTRTKSKTMLLPPISQGAGAWRR